MADKTNIIRKHTKRFQMGNQHNIHSSVIKVSIRSNQLNEGVQKLGLGSASPIGSTEEVFPPEDESRANARNTVVSFQNTERWIKYRQTAALQVQAFFLFFSFYGLGISTCSNPELLRYMVALTPWTGDQPVERSLPTQDSRMQQDADRHASSGIKTQDPWVRATRTRGSGRDRQVQTERMGKWQTR